MMDDSGTHKLRLSDIQNAPSDASKDGFSKDEIDTLADLIGGKEEPSPDIDLEDTGRFTR
jgi:hypothetical protein